MAQASVARVIEILREHEVRLKCYQGEDRCREGDLFVAALLPVLMKCTNPEHARTIYRNLGKSPGAKYHLEHPNAALRQLCGRAIQRLKAAFIKRLEVPDEFLATHCIECQECGKQFLAKRGDARFCGATCQKRVRRRVNKEAMSGINPVGVS